MNKVLHCITALDMGGAEAMLCKILSNYNKEKFEHVVFSLKGGGKVSGIIRAKNILVYELEIEKIGVRLFFNLLKMICVFFKFKPDVIFGWMYHGNLFALMLYALRIGKTKLIWSIRQSLYDIKKEKRHTAFMIKMGALFSHFPSVIIYNSKKSSEQHSEYGYDDRKKIVIPNGFDCKQFYPDAKKRRDMRKLLGIDEEFILIATVARFHPMKNHFGFIKVAEMLLKEYPDLAFVMAGRGVDKDNIPLTSFIDQRKISKHFFLLGEQDDMPLIMNGLDILVSPSSWGEGFPNILGEAMATGVPCVATDVGDSGDIVGNLGVVVPHNKLVDLFKGIKMFIDMSKEQRNTLSIKLKFLIKQKYSIDNIIKKYEQQYRS